MSTASPQVRAVVAHFQRMLGSDGTTVDLAAVEPDAIRIRYSRGECDTCGLEPADLGAMMEELLAKQGASGLRVVVDEVPQSSLRL